MEIKGANIDYPLSCECHNSIRCIFKLFVFLYSLPHWPVEILTSFFKMCILCSPAARQMQETIWLQKNDHLQLMLTKFLKLWGGRGGVVFQTNPTGKKEYGTSGKFLHLIPIRKVYHLCDFVSVQVHHRLFILISTHSCKFWTVRFIVLRFSRLFMRFWWICHISGKPCLITCPPHQFKRFASSSYWTPAVLVDMLICLYVCMSWPLK